MTEIQDIRSAAEAPDRFLARFNTRMCRLSNTLTLGVSACTKWLKQSTRPANKVKLCGKRTLRCPLILITLSTTRPNLLVRLPSPKGILSAKVPLLVTTAPTTCRKLPFSVIILIRPLLRATLTLTTRCVTVRQLPLRTVRTTFT